MNFIQRFCAAAVLIVTAGCVNIDYIGQKLAPLPDEQLVTFFSEKQNVPQQEFALIGRAEVSAPDGTEILLIKEKLQDQAREVGADAVKIVSMERVKVGTIQVSGSGSQPEANSTASAMSRTIGGDPIYTDSFGRTAVQPSRIEDKYEVILQVQFFAGRDKFDNAMRERNIEREKAIQERIAEEEKALQDYTAANAKEDDSNESSDSGEVQKNTKDDSNIQ